MMKVRSAEFFPYLAKTVPVSRFVPKTSQPSATAATLDAHPGAISSLLDAQMNCVAFIEGSRPHISSETTCLLRTRLRAAAGLLGLAFGVFFVWRLMFNLSGGTLETITFYAHFGITIALCASFFLLCRKCKIPLGVLRGYELAIFGLPVAYFAVSQYSVMQALAREGALQSPLASWMGTVFIYAMFIPNTWRRAAIFIGTMCALPAVMIAILWYRDPAFASVLDSHPGFASEVVIMMGVTCLASIYGTHLINTLLGRSIGGFTQDLLGVVLEDGKKYQFDVAVPKPHTPYCGPCCLYPSQFRRLPLLKGCR